MAGGESASLVAGKHTPFQGEAQIPSADMNQRIRNDIRESQGNNVAETSCAEERTNLAVDAAPNPTTSKDEIALPEGAQIATMDGEQVIPFEDQFSFEDGEIRFLIDLEEDLEREGLLGSDIYTNQEEYLTQPRKQVTGVNKKDYSIGVRCRRPHYGTAKDENNKDVPAALIVIDITFVMHKIGLASRFKRVQLEVDFEDAININLKSQGFPEDRTHRPAVLCYRPESYQGPITQLVGQTSHQLNAMISAPQETGSFGAKRTTARPTVVEGSLGIFCTLTGDPGSLLRWEIHENKAKKTGLMPKLTLGAIVACTPGRKFGAQVQVEADLRLPFLPSSLACGKRDDPLFFTYPADIVHHPLEEELYKVTKIDPSIAALPAEIIGLPKEEPGSKEDEEEAGEEGKAEE